MKSQKFKFKNQSVLLQKIKFNDKHPKNYIYQKKDHIKSCTKLFERRKIID